MSITTAFDSLNIKLEKARRKRECSCYRKGQGGEGGKTKEKPSRHLHSNFLFSYRDFARLPIYILRCDVTPVRT
jgi:hypothetical protein